MMSEAEEVKPDLPKGWAWTNLENCVEILDCQRIPINAKDRETRKGEIPYYGATGQTGWIDDYLFDEELVLLGEDGAPFLDPSKNKSYIISGKSWVNNHAHVLKAINGLTINHFILYYLNIFHYDDYVSGTTRLKLNQAPMKKIPIPLAPLPEQLRIVARIEELFSRLDAGVKALQRAKAQLQRYRQAFLKAAVEGRLTEEWRRTHQEIEPAEKLLDRIINLSQKKTSKKSRDPREVAITITGFPSLPESWLWVRLDSIASLKGGITKDAQRRINNGHKVPYLRVANVQRGYLDLSEIKEIEASEEVISELRLECGDILFNEGGDRDKLGRGWIWQGELPECIHQNHVIRARLYSNEVSSKFVSWFGNTYGQEYFLKEGKQTTNLASINLTKLSEFPVPLPPNEEQTVIVEEIEKRISMANESEKNIDQSLKHAIRLRQSILKRAFEGKLVPQDTNDEHAKVLLERIEANKKKQTPIKETKYRNKYLKTNGKKRETNLYELLRSSTRFLTPSELWIQSNLDIEDFYCRLKLEIEKGRIIEDKVNNKLIVKDETT